jgi:two-component system, NtrC family, response regulator AlgB
MAAEYSPRVPRAGTCSQSTFLSPESIAMPKLLIVDDDRNIRLSLVRTLQPLGYEVHSADGGPQALQLIARLAEFDLVLSDWRMAEMNGLELLKKIKETCEKTVVILMTAYGTVENAVAAMKEGAYDYLTKPFSVEQIRRTIERAQAHRLRSQLRSRNAATAPAALATRSPYYQLLLETAYAAASSDATLLLTGETGTGKNVLARQIHQWSARCQRTFTIVNCTTLSDPLLESELFGHVKGSFTGAFRDKPGRLEAADGGTVFLDEVAELPLNLQAKFLRYLQEGCFERVGGQQTTQVDTRIIAATNRKLEEEVSRGCFRADLYYRLNVINLRVPPLRERSEDILPLAEKLLMEAATRNGRTQLQFAPEAEAALLAYSWPGNVRELRNVVERAAVLSRGRLIRNEDLSETVFRTEGLRAAEPYPKVTLEAVEQEHIRRILDLSPTLEEAATTLGIGSATLWRKRKRYSMR